MLHPMGRTRCENAEWIKQNPIEAYQSGEVGVQFESCGYATEEDATCKMEEVEEDLESDPEVIAPVKAKFVNKIHIFLE